MLDLVIVMPVYNEEECIEEVISSWLSKIRSMPIPFKMIVVNDGSKDSSAEILNRLEKFNSELKIYHTENRGHGQALFYAYDLAIKEKPEWIFHVDSDNQFSPEDFSKLWDRREYPFIIGSRKDRQDTKHRLVITNIMKTIISLLTGFKIEDPNSPYRLINSQWLSLLLKEIPKNLFAPNIFLAVLSSLKGRVPLFISVKHLPRKTGEVSIVKLGLLKACFITAFDLLVFSILKRKDPVKNV